MFNVQCFRVTPPCAEMDGSSFDFSRWAAECKLKQELIEALVAEDYDDYEVLCMLTSEDIMELATKYSFSIGMRLSLKRCAEELQAAGRGADAENNQNNAMVSYIRDIYI